MGLMLDEYYARYISDRSNLLLRRLYINIEKGKLYSTRYLLDNANIKLSGDSGRFALYLAAKIPRERTRPRHMIFKWLLQAGCDLNHLDGKGFDVLFWLLAGCETALVKILLINYKMDINLTLTDEKNNTSLMYAVWTKDVETVTMLSEIYIQFGIDLDVRNKDGFTPYTEALRLKLYKISDCLIYTGKVSLYASVTPFESIQRKLNKSNPNFSQMRINLSRVNLQLDDANSKRIQENISKTKNPKENLSSDEEPSEMKIYKNVVHQKKMTKIDVSSRTEKSVENLSKDMNCPAIINTGKTKSGMVCLDEFRQSNKEDNGGDYRWKKFISTERGTIDSSGTESSEEVAPVQENESRRVRFTTRSSFPPGSGLSDGRISRMGQVNAYSKNSEINRFRDAVERMPDTQKPLNVSTEKNDITYNDVREMFPQRIAVQSNATSLDEIQWLLLMQADQSSTSFLKARSSPIVEPEKIVKKKDRKVLTLQKRRSDITGYSIS